MKYLMVILIVLTIPFIMTLSVRSFPEHASQIPNGNVLSCSSCHTGQHGGSLNLFGQHIQDDFLDENIDIIWGSVLARVDSDGDGASNGVELQDPDGNWRIGQASPGNAMYVTNPGDTLSHPFVSITLQLSAMDPHVGQKFELRVVDGKTFIEIMRTSLDRIVSGSFTIEIENLLLGRSYRIDFYTDHNGNGIYDPPPTDHAWRLDVYDLASDETLNFVHNSDFWDIEWPAQTRIELGTAEGPPREFALSQNYPNPFNPRTDIRYQIVDSSTPLHTILVIFNVLGQEVRMLVDEVQAAGYYTVTWDGTDNQGKKVNSGVYFYQLIAADFRNTRRMLLLK